MEIFDQNLRSKAHNYNIPYNMPLFSYITCIKSKCLDLSGGASPVCLFFFSFNILKCDLSPFCVFCILYFKKIACQIVHLCKSFYMMPIKSMSVRQRRNSLTKVPCPPWLKPPTATFFLMRLTIICV